MFKVKGFRESLFGVTYPIFSLTIDSWDDFGTKCSFHLTYHKTKYESVEIGTVKILQKDKNVTDLPDEFSNLGETYISLGQDLDFYRSLLSAVGSEESEEVLESLNDISWKPIKAEPFESASAYRNALFRENGARSSFRFGRSIISGEKYTEHFSFEYTAHIEGADSPFTISVDFDERDVLPGRIVGLIGRNAVGKTQLMAALAKDLVQVGRISQKAIDEKNQRFEGERPIFSRVITISYSAFDKFIRPKNPQVSYVYCGIRNERGGLSKTSLLENYKSNLAKIVELGREDAWVSFMSEILDDTSGKFISKLEREVDSKIDSDALSLMSSGQSILAHFVTALVARIQENTLVLFDEPETHLHPNAVAHLFNVMNKMLKKYNSFAIIATHSPIVIQEIPRKRVILLTREGNSTISSLMSFETFGESISELTKHVFDTVSINNHYKSVLKRLAKKYTPEAVDKLFDSGLSFNAKAYLLAQYGSER
ncbi:ATP-dependent endonuclease [Microbulbifer sp. ALW1]|uniref:ATP-dependent nuclease n=1 Tax=Microbulbifer sp. (strain ALW1) TaxID=1516059 RepID=UPI001356837C|nr:AAA family ATPase [Microbulbifer sp. ALW1]